MFSLLKSFAMSLTLGAGLLLVGCQSDGSQTQASPSHEMASSAVACDKCQTTWVKMPIENQKGRLVAYSSRKEMACPDCKDAVSNFFATGKLEHTCKTCGGNMTICEAH